MARQKSFKKSFHMHWQCKDDTFLLVGVEEKVFLNQKREISPAVCFHLHFKESIRN